MASSDDITLTLPPGAPTANKPYANFFYDTQPPSDQAYIPTAEEQEKISLLYRRFLDMRNSPARIAAEQEWKDGYDAYEGKIQPLAADDERTNLNLDPTFAIVETINQETIERSPRPFYKPFEANDKAIVTLGNTIARSTFDRGNFDREFKLMKTERDITGTACLMEFYRFESRWVKDLDIKKDPKTGQYIESYTEKELVDWDDVYAMWRPIHEFYFDPSALHIDQAKDMVWRQVLHINEFRRLYSTRRGFKNVDKVTVGRKYDDDQQYGVPTDLNHTYDVEVLHYYNRATDEYNVLTNHVLVREGPIPYPHKELPISVYYCYKTPRRFYGLGIPFIIKHEAAEITTSSNLTMDYQKRAIQKMFFIDDTADVSDEDLLPRPHGIIPVTTDGKPISQVVMPLEYGDVKVSTYKDREVLYESIRRKTGIDERIQGVEKGGTATEAAIMKEASIKRIQAQTLFNEMDGLTRLGRLRWANILFFYSLPKIKRIAGDDGNLTVTTEPRMIAVKGKSFAIDADGNLQMEDIDGYSSLTLDKKFMKYLNSNVDIEIDVQEGQVMSKTVKQAKMLELFDRFSLPAAAPFANLPGALKRLAEINDEKPDDWLKPEDLKDDPTAVADAEFSAMLSGIDLPPTPEASEAHITHELVLAQSLRFHQAPSDVQQIVERHIAGEDAALRQQAGGVQGNPSMGGASPTGGAMPPGTPQGGPMLPAPNQAPVNVQPTNVQGGSNA